MRVQRFSDEVLRALPLNSARVIRTDQQEVVAINPGVKGASQRQEPSNSELCPGKQETVGRKEREKQKPNL